MGITESALTAQYQQACSAWPFIHQAELARGLPRMLPATHFLTCTNVDPCCRTSADSVKLIRIDVTADKTRIPAKPKRGPARGERISVGQHERTGTHHRTREEL